jgi:hypothetical protein
MIKQRTSCINRIKEGGDDAETKSTQEKEEINRLPKDDLRHLQLYMLNTKDINYYMDYLQEQDAIMCNKVSWRKPSLFYKVGFIKYNTKNNPQCRTTTPRCARGENIFKMRYLYTNPPRHTFYMCCYLH